MKMTTWMVITSAMLLNLSLCSDEDKEPEAEVATAGRADVTLSAGGEMYTIKGSSGWVSVVGVNYIGVKDDNNSLKTMSIFFNIDELPKVTTSFDLVNDSMDEDPKHVTMNITEMKNGSLFEYRSTTGKVVLEVNGKEVKINLNGIKLKPTTSSPIYTSLNTGAFSKEGTLSGSIAFG